MEFLYITLSRCHAPKSEVHAFGLFLSRITGTGSSTRKSEPFDEVSLIVFSSYVKSQCRTVLATSNTITCLWHGGMRHRGGRTVIQARWRNVGSRSRNAKGNAESDEQGRNVPKSASVADCPVVALKCL